jgi:hypothetical protein
VIVDSVLKIRNGLTKNAKSTALTVPQPLLTPKPEAINDEGVKETILL